MDNPGFKLAAVAAACAWAAAWGAAAAAETPMGDPLTQADRLRLAGDYESALGFYGSVLAEDPLAADALIGAAFSLEALDEAQALGFLSAAASRPAATLPPAAAAVFAAALARRGADARALAEVPAEGAAAGGRAGLVAGGVYFGVSDWPRAIKAFKEARAGGAAAAPYAVGEALLAAGQYDEAEIYLSEFLRTFPYVAPARCARGEAYYYQGDDERAAAEWRDALRYDPACVRARFDLATQALARGDWGGAIRGYGDVWELDPGDGRALLGMAAAYDHVDPAVARAKRDEYRRRFGGNL